MESRIRIIATPRKMQFAFKNSKDFTIKFYEKKYDNGDGTCEYDAIVRHREPENHQKITKNKRLWTTNNSTPLIIWTK